MAATLHVRLDFLVTKGPLVPSNSTICPRNGQKRRQKAPKTAQCAPAPRNQERAASWATWLKTEFRGHLGHPQSPTFYGFQPSESPNKTRRPPYQWSLGAAGGLASPRTVGANGGSTRVPQQATKGARHRAVLAIAPSQHLGPDSTLAILEPTWWPCQIQVLSQKLSGGDPGQGRQVGRCPPKSAQFWAKNSHFSPKTALVRVQNSQTKANGCYTSRAA